MLDSETAGMSVDDDLTLTLSDAATNGTMQVVNLQIDIMVTAPRRAWRRRVVTDILI